MALNEFGLTEMQEKFCEEYVADPKRNGSQAAVRAGYAENSARISACKMLTLANIKSRIRDLEREMLAASDYSPEEIRKMVFRQYVRIATADVTDYVAISSGSDDPDRDKALDAVAAANGGQKVLDFDGVICYPTDRMTNDKTAPIKSIKVRNVGGKQIILAPEIELEDKTAALNALARMSGLIDGDTNVTVNTAPAVILQMVEERHKAADGGSVNG